MRSAAGCALLAVVAWCCAGGGARAGTFHPNDVLPSASPGTTTAHTQLAVDGDTQNSGSRVRAGRKRMLRFHPQASQATVTMVNNTVVKNLTVELPSACGASTLTPGAILLPGHSLVSQNGHFNLRMQPDGNVIMFDVCEHKVLFALGVGRRGHGLAGLTLEPNGTALLRFGSGSGRAHGIPLLVPSKPSRVAALRVGDDAHVALVGEAGAVLQRFSGGERGAVAARAAAERAVFALASGGGGCERNATLGCSSHASTHTYAYWTQFHREFNLVGRELCVLKRLQRFPWCPRLLGSTTDTITLSYVGTAVTSETLPNDYAAQFRQILSDMESVGVRHNDIMDANRVPNACSPTRYREHEVKVLDGRKMEVMVLDGRLSLIDFGWATVDGGMPCNVSTHLFPMLGSHRWRACDDTTILNVLDGMAESARYSTTEARAPAIPPLQNVLDAPETHLMILWDPLHEKGCRSAWDSVKRNFAVVKVHMHPPFPNRTVRIQTMNAFYETTRRGTDVDDVRGTVPFVIIVVRTLRSEYGSCEGGASARGLDKCPPGNPWKVALRRKHVTVHATDSVAETIGNMGVLGYNYSQAKALVEKSEPFQTIGGVFQAMSEAEVEWVVARNWELLQAEGKPEESHPDVDLFVNDHAAAANAIRAVPVHPPWLIAPRHYDVRIGRETWNFDVRAVGENDYIDGSWMEHCIERRQAVPLAAGADIMYVMNNSDYFYTLLYHATVYKPPPFRPDYAARLKKMARALPEAEADKLSIVRALETAQGRSDLLGGYLLEQGYTNRLHH